MVNTSALTRDQNAVKADVNWANFKLHFTEK